MDSEFDLQHSENSTLCNIKWSLVKGKVLSGGSGKEKESEKEKRCNYHFGETNWVFLEIRWVNCGPNTDRLFFLLISTGLQRRKTSSEGWGIRSEQHQNNDSDDELGGWIRTWVAGNREKLKPIQGGGEAQSPWSQCTVWTGGAVKTSKLSWRHEITSKVRQVSSWASGGFSSLGQDQLRFQNGLCSELDIWYRRGWTHF